jgi:hypothetical protein
VTQLPVIPVAKPAGASQVILPRAYIGGTFLPGSTTPNHLDAAIWLGTAVQLRFRYSALFNVATTT